MEPKPNPTKIATKWAFIFIITTIVFTYGTQYLGVDPNSPIKYIGFLPFILFLFLAQVEFKNSLGGFLTFGQGFSAGFRYALFAGILSAIFIYLYLAVLSPDVFEKSLQTQRDQMIAKGMSEDQVNKCIEIGKKIGPAMGAFVSAIFYAAIGAVISLIGAAIFKKEPTGFDLNNTNYTDPTV